MIFKTTSHILNNPWKEDVPNVDSNPKVLPPNSPWNKERDPTLDDIKLWEQIHYEPGNVGVYAAWDPYLDFYMIVYNLFLDTEYGVKTFYGNDASNNVKKEMEQIGIDLKEVKIWKS